MEEIQNSEKIRCSNCKCWRELNSFIGKHEQQVKRCAKCREKDERQKQKPDVREKRNQRQQEKKYYIAYREKKRADNEEAFLQHNAELMKQWRQNNKEHLSAWKTKNFISRLWAIKDQALKKNISWSDTMTDNICKDMMNSPCFYCNITSELTLNGIDRMNSLGDYTLENCVSCCKVCNFMKTCLDVNTFIKRCKHISIYHGGNGEQYTSIWKDTKRPVIYENYKKRAERKQLPFLITLEEFNSIRTKICYYCGKENTSSHMNGVDRKNNTLGYTIENCVSCCGECNYMKGELDMEEFIQKCKCISEYKSTCEDIPNIPVHLSVTRYENKN